MAAQNIPGLIVLLWLVVIIVVDFFIVRAVWRAVNRPRLGALPADQPKRKKPGTMLWVLLIPVLVVAVIGVPVTLYLSVAKRSDAARAQIHTRVFEADANLVDELVPGPTRTTAQIQDSKEALRIEPSKAAQTAHAISRAAQTAEISAEVFARLLEDGANPPGVLDEEVREGAWWPKVATNSHYMRHGEVAGGGNLDGFLGLWRDKGVLQLRVEYNGMHGMNSAYQVVTIVGEGRAPQPEAARVFFIPVSRTDGTARYLIIAVEVGNGTENAGGLPNVRREKQQVTAHSATFSPLMERVLPSDVQIKDLIG
jgi:hypothetical protein